MWDRFQDKDKIDFYAHFAQSHFIYCGYGMSLVGIALLIIGGCFISGAFAVTAAIGLTLFAMGLLPEMARAHLYKNLEPKDMYEVIVAHGLEFRL